MMYFKIVNFMWKFHDFSITQILREILEILEVQNLPFLHIKRLWNFICMYFLKAEIYQIYKIQSP